MKLAKDLKTMLLEVNILTLCCLVLGLGPVGLWVLILVVSIPTQLYLWYYSKYGRYR